MAEKTNPYEMELLDLWNEVGGQMIIKYHTATIKPDKGDLQQLRDKGFKTDIMTCIIANIGAHLGKEKAMIDFRELLKDFVRLSEGRDKEPNGGLIGAGSQ